MNTKLTYVLDSEIILFFFSAAQPKLSFVPRLGAQGRPPSQ